ncbi:MAG: hypothetical protein JSS49_10545 [Planctomycetes bacterium]|nr:hypothetical protein [Planctomycetota bacterium]
MFDKFRFPMVMCVIATFAAPLPCQAYVETLRLPLCGCRDYAVGQGSVTFTESFGEKTRSDGGTLIIEVSNIPLPPGTELRVIVHDREIGTLKLDKRRNGRFVLEGTAKKAVPKLTSGSSVVLKLENGVTVLW